MFLEYFPAVSQSNQNVQVGTIIHHLEFPHNDSLAKGNLAV